MASGDNRSITGVLQDIVARVQEIIRSEIRLAKAELKEETVQAGKATAVLASGALLGIYALGLLLLACVYALALALPAWIAALIVAVVVAAIAGVLLNRGLNTMRRVHAAPEKTIRTIKENVQWAKHQPR
ncbi:MAG: hypothetical protein JWO19_5187 [Bryobacterales bacterium]|nr:hypothetical protein [Bryobacterales bacterium]